MKLKYEVKQIQNINNILKNELNLSTRLLNRLIKNKNITINKKEYISKENIKIGDIIQIDFDYEEDNSNIVPTKMDLNILYEDEWMLVVEKPAGVPIHPSMLHFTDSLSNGIRFYFDSIGLKKKIRPVNRLDLGTSGIVIFAKCEYIQEGFIKQMNSKKLKKEYLGIVDGVLEKKSGTINLPIARKEGSIIERCVDIKNGQPSITHYEVIKEYKNYSLIKFILETGGTHQIRVHMVNIEHPILGDTLYSRECKLITRQALHSYKIECVHPVSKENLIFESKLPEDMKHLII